MTVPVQVPPGTEKATPPVPPSRLGTDAVRPPVCALIRPPAVAHPLVGAACIDTAARSRIYAAARSTIDAAARSRFSSGSTLYMASGPARGFRPRSAVRTLRAQQRGANIKSATISSDRGNCRVENQQVQKELVEKSVVL